LSPAGTQAKFRLLTKKYNLSEDMQFDIIIGNPPYQQRDGGAQASAKPIYHHFISTAKKLNPRYLLFIVPARWYAGGKGLNDFRNEMLNDRRIRVLHDYIRASDCFSEVEIKGGICFFLWDRDFQGDCKVNTHIDGRIVSVAERPLLEKGADVFIRHNEAVQIWRKVQKFNEDTFTNIVSPGRPFGFRGFFDKYKEKPFSGAVKLYANQKIGYVARSQIEQNVDWVDKYKVLVPKATGVGNVQTDWLKPFIAEPNSCCTETFLVFGPCKSKKEAENIISYVQTRFFHLFLSFKKISQDAWKKAYQFVPMQDFCESWSDEKLYKKYGLTKGEINFIESMIRGMEYCFVPHGNWDCGNVPLQIV
jgi:site-specific DNA-methyltransferase (adenine-specific)